MTYRKKLIEVALPLDAISEASVREKSIRHNHPSTFHLWWARRPLAACRAVLFASIIDDPSEHPEKFPNELEQNIERIRLFKLIEEMVKWENSNDERFLGLIRSEIRLATDNHPPSVLDPFAGGGSIPLEAQRLGLEAYANDLNPVAVLINKTLIEFPAKFANLAPINSDMKISLLEHEWLGARGLTNDIRFYAKLLCEKVKKSIEHLYPKVQLPKEYGDNEANVIAWIWTRTMLCPNPACGIQMPLISSLWLSKKKGNETWLEPQIDYQSVPPKVRFNIATGEGGPPAPSKIGRGAQFKCLCCGTNVIEQQVKDAGQKRQIGANLITIIADGKHGRIYLPASQDHEDIALSANPDWYPSQEISKNPRWFSPPIYGMSTYSEIFTKRQLTALTTFSQTIKEIGNVVFNDCLLVTKDHPFAVDYSNAIVTYLAFAVDKCANYWSSICSWHSGRDAVTSTFGRQAIPMVWDFAEVNPFSNSTGNFLSQVDYLVSVLDANDYITPGVARQADAATDNRNFSNILISTRSTRQCCGHEQTRQRH